MKLLVVVVGASLVTSGCAQNASLEKRLIGTWAGPALYCYAPDRSHTLIPLSKEVMEITFTDDHRETWRYRGKPPDTVALWHLEGNDLVFKIISKPKGTSLPTNPQRERIVKVTAKEAIFTDGTTEGRWTRVR
jgi:hypothetical protein